MRVYAHTREGKQLIPLRHALPKIPQGSSDWPFAEAWDLISFSFPTWKCSGPWHQSPVQDIVLDLTTLIPVISCVHLSRLYQNDFFKFRNPVTFLLFLNSSLLSLPFYAFSLGSSGFDVTATQIILEVLCNAPFEEDWSNSHSNFPLLNSMFSCLSKGKPPCYNKGNVPLFSLVALGLLIPTIFPYMSLLPFCPCWSPLAVAFCSVIKIDMTLMVLLTYSH